MVVDMLHLPNLFYLDLAATLFVSLCLYIFCIGLRPAGCQRSLTLGACALYKNLFRMTAAFDGVVLSQPSKLQGPVLGDQLVYWFQMSQSAARHILVGKAG
eukprot:15352406-Ditylum_brightwellii.AAC.1